ncbi:12002_t:CDS:2 [Entrophospora sp. SA101]|nr:14602_t:CDS:2 [Entrophospora sp. SA101]CAJ0906350.1 12002_t:CDS:2 [Entrophospora sp. SA101]CAJ0917014.1 176_t:CDS:2 [Entrophospora sp. SA101]
MNRPRIAEPKPTLNVSINPHLYRRLKKEIGDRKVSGFVERAIAKELGEHDSQLEREQKEFERKLIADYQKESSQTLDKEDKINNWQNRNSRYAVVAPLTSEEKKLKYVASFEVLIEANQENGLDEKSKILFHRLLTVEKDLRLIERKGKVEKKILTQAWKAL